VKFHLPAAFVALVRLDRQIRLAANGMRRKATACTASYRTWNCPVHGTKHTEYHQGHDHKCTCTRGGCRKKAASARGKRSRKVLGLLGGQDWSVDEMTVPPQMQPRLAEDASYRKAVCDAAWDTLQYIHIKWSFRGRRVDLGCTVFQHPTGDDETRWRWHLHFVTPLIGQDEAGERWTGRYKLPPEALDEFRAAWKKRLHDEFGVDVTGDVDVHHGFRIAGASLDDVEEQEVADARMAHASRYVARTFPTWKPLRPRYLGLLSPTGKRLWKTTNEASAEPIPPAPPPPPAPAAADHACPECGADLLPGPQLWAAGNEVYRYFGTRSIRDRIGTAFGTPAEAWVVRPRDGPRSPPVDGT
jgi:hypothetical protein